MELSERVSVERRRAPRATAPSCTLNDSVGIERFFFGQVVDGEGSCVARSRRCLHAYQLSQEPKDTTREFVSSLRKQQTLAGSPSESAAKPQA
jgi:hypothetical protein